MPWESWRFFALQLFQCRDEAHKIGGIALDGYLKGASVLVFNHLKNPGARFTEETLDEMHEALGSRVGRKFFIIAPALTFDFQQDYINKDDVRYYALRIPYSIIHELHQRQFAALKQPSDEMAVNDTVEAVGFDFIHTPELDYDCGVSKRKGELLSEAFIQDSKVEIHPRRNRPGAGAALRVYGGGVGLRRHQIPPRPRHRERGGMRDCRVKRFE